MRKGYTMPQILSPHLLPALDYNIVVFSHLRWEFVYQRPQHIISRLGNEYKILFVEEPIPLDENEENNFVKKQITENIHVLQPRINNMNDIGALLIKYLSSAHYPIAWFYSAAFLPILNDINFDTIIYDCMDELSLFKGASHRIVTQEKMLLQIADIVFTGGHSLYESKKYHNTNTHCFRSSVDAAHFGKICSIDDLPEDVADIPKPMVGYLGVIDERIDLNLLKETAQKMPHVSFVMIGPVVKIDNSDLPILPNIFYKGQKDYQDLPYYLAAFDIAMMPFSLNDSTKFISPTKTLEYMAAGKPIISTRIRDVVNDYSAFISFVETSDDFCDAVNHHLSNNGSLTDEYEKILKNTSWDVTVAQMNKIIKQAMNL